MVAIHTLDGYAKCAECQVYCCSNHFLQSEENRQEILKLWREQGTRFEEGIRMYIVHTETKDPYSYGDLWYCKNCAAKMGLIW